MSCLSSPMAAPAEYVKNMGRHSDTESTTAHDSDIETVTDSCSTQLASPRVPSGVCEEEEGPCNVVVRSTFIDLDDGCGLLQRYRRLRRAQTDSALVAVSPQEAYEPGRFSDDRAKREMQSSVAEAPALAKRPDPPRQEERTTVMLRNIPNNYTRDMFLALLDHHGFAGRYDFAYLPCDFYRDANLGCPAAPRYSMKVLSGLWGGGGKTCGKTYRSACVLDLFSDVSLFASLFKNPSP